jgi:hypothetical protein
LVLDDLYPQPKKVEEEVIDSLPHPSPI